MPARKRKRQEQEQEETQERWWVEVVHQAKRENTPDVIRPGELKRKLYNRGWMYLVKWGGFPSSDNSWQPAANLRGCDRLLLSFWEHVGEELFFTGVKGYLAIPDREWIENEKLRFKEVPPEEVQAQILNPKRPRTSMVTPRAEARKSESPPRASRTRARAQRKRKCHDPSSDSDDSSSDSDSSSESSSDGVVELQAPPLENNDSASAPASPEAEAVAEVPHSIIMWDGPDGPISEGYMAIKTKMHLAKADVAPGLFRLTRNGEDDEAVELVQRARRKRAVDAPVEDAPCTTLVCEADCGGFPADDDEDGPDEAPGFCEEGAGGAGFYEDGEDRYAGIPRNGEDFVASAGDFGAEHGHGPLGSPGPDVENESDFFAVDQFLSTVAVPLQNAPGPHPASPPTDDAEDLGSERGPLGSPGPDVENEFFAVDQFLSTVAVPLQNAPSLDPASPPTAIEYQRRECLYWSGHLTISCADNVELVCEKAVITGSAEATSLEPRLSSLLPAKEISFTKFYDAEDVEAVPWGSASQLEFARLAAEGAEAARFDVLVEYMCRKSQAVVMSALDRNGYFVFVPPSAKSLLEQLRVPPDMCAPGCLAVVLVLDRRQKCRWQEDEFGCKHWRRTVSERAQWVSQAEWRRSLRTERVYHLALHKTKLPLYIRELARDHASIVWPSTRDGDDRAVAQDTEPLLQVLAKSKGVVAPELDAGVVFIHGSALGRVYELPHLARRRLCPDVVFCLYGRRWGFREIYAMGGVLTFTAQALIDDTWGVLKLIRDVHARRCSVWSCYIMPEVFGLACKVVEDSEGLLPLAFDRICDEILEGKVALMAAPPPPNRNAEVERWILDHSLLHPITKSAILGRCREAFDGAYASVARSGWVGRAKENVLEDLRRMQCLPALVDYRRFVVVDVGTADAGADAELRDGGIEWRAMGDLGFEDDLIADD